MNRLFLITVFLLLSHSIVYSQEWAPIGATWTYSNQQFWPPGMNTPSTIESVGDTLIEGKLCRIFYGVCNCGFDQTVPILYFDDEKVYYYVDSIIGFTTLYDFSAGVGDTWTFIVHNFVYYDTSVFIVNDIVEEIIDGDTITVQYVQNVDEYDTWQWGGKIYKYIGDYSCFYPQHALADPWTGPIRCYEDSTTMIKFQDIPCDTSIIHIGINENVLKNLIKIFPNPATSFITINIKEGIPIEQAIIYNHLGQKALVAVPVNNTVDVSKLKPGIYMVVVFTKENQARQKLVVK